MKKFKFLFLFFLLIASSQLLVANPVSAAETEVYPGGVGTQANATSDGWTDNHLVGQSFTPQNINKVTKVKLTNFKLGDASGNKGGIVSVALFQGEPTASTVPGGDGAGNTTRISPSGAMLAKVGKIFIGGELANDLASFCGVDQNTIEALFLRRLIITNPDRPCPKQSEWTRAYQMLSDNQQGLRDEWSDWGVPYGTSVVFGDSTFDWTPAPQGYNMYQAGQYYKGDNPSRYTGPSWTTQTVSWQGTDNADNYLEVTLPTHSLVPGQPYFLSIQQSYFNQADYYEEGKYNCAGPNEGGIVTLQGTNINGNTVQLSGETCDKGHVFVAQIDTGNRYAGGRAYFNTYYYLASGYIPATGDLTNLKIWGNQAFPPTASITGPTAGTVGQTLTYTATANDLDNNLTRGEIWVARTNSTNQNDLLLWTSDCPGGGSPPRRISGSWCNLADTSLSGGGPVPFSGSWTPSTTGNYYVVVNAFDNGGFFCSGNPQLTFNGGTLVLPGWSDCGANDSVKVTVIETVGLSIQYGNNPNVVSGFQGALKTSGLQAADGGSNWYNYLNIAETAYSATGDGAHIDAVAVAFVPNPPSQTTTFSSALDQANEGFVVAYSQGNSLPYPNSQQTFPSIPGHYYVFYQGGWRDMGNPVAENKNLEFYLCSNGYWGGSLNFNFNANCNNTNVDKIRVTGRRQDDYHQVSTNSLTVKWDVYTWSSFTSKQLNIYGWGKREANEGFLSEEDMILRKMNLIL